MSWQASLRATLACPHALDERAHLEAAERHFEAERWEDGFRELGLALRAQNGGILPTDDLRKAPRVVAARKRPASGTRGASERARGG